MKRRGSGRGKWTGKKRDLCIFFFLFFSFFWLSFNSLKRYRHVQICIYIFVFVSVFEYAFRYRSHERLLGVVDANDPLVLFVLK